MSQQYRAVLTACFIRPTGYPPKHINWSDVCLFGNSIMLMYILLFLRKMIFNELWRPLKLCICKSNRGSFAPEYSLSHTAPPNFKVRGLIYSEGWGFSVGSIGPFSHEPKHPRKHLWSRERGRESGTTWLCSWTHRFPVVKEISLPPLPWLPCLQNKDEFV